MKKLFIFAFVMMCALAASAQEYWINDNFSAATAETGYLDTPYTLQGSGSIELTRYQCNFEVNTVMGLRVGDTGKGGYAEFSIPAGSGVGTITLNFKAKGSTANRIAIVSINGMDEPNITEVGATAPKEFEKTLNTNDAVTVRVRSGNTDPIILNSIQATKLGEGAGISDLFSSRKAAGYYNLLGQRLSEMPAGGAYIIRYDDGTAEKAMIRK